MAWSPVGRSGPDADNRLEYSLDPGSNSTGCLCFGLPTHRDCRWPQHQEATTCSKWLGSDTSVCPVPVSAAGSTSENGPCGTMLGPLEYTALIEHLGALPPVSEQRRDLVNVLSGEWCPLGSDAHGRHGIKVGVARPSSRLDPACSEVDRGGGPPGSARIRIPEAVLAIPPTTPGGSPGARRIGTRYAAPRDPAPPGWRWSGSDVMRGPRPGRAPDGEENMRRIPRRRCD